jgi:hypothetical protein
MRIFLGKKWLQSGTTLFLFVIERAKVRDFFCLQIGDGLIERPGNAVPIFKIPSKPCLSKLGRRFGQD